MTRLLGVGVGRVGDGAVGLDAGAEVDEQGGVAAVVEDHVGPTTSPDPSRI